MKRYLLIAGDNYYPGYETSDWVGTYATKKEAENAVVKEELPPQVFIKGPRKGEVIPNQLTEFRYTVNGSEVDWYTIVDLFDWM